MFSTTILDVAAGVIFGFLAISLFASAAVEAINSALKTRARNLKTGVMALLNDSDFEKLARSLYQHALISPLGPGAPASTDPKVSGPIAAAYDKWGNLPSYIDKNRFAKAFLDVTKLSEKAPSAQALKAQIDEIQDPQIKQFLQGVFNRVGADLSKIETEVADWFDGSMDRLSGVFKRRTQALTFFIALVFALLINLDTIRIATVLWEEPTIAQRLKDVVVPAPTTPKTDDEAILNAEAAISLVEAMAQSGIPVGWPPGHFFGVKNGDKWDWFWNAPNSSLAWSLLGWLITATASIFGASFWFDTLQSVIRLKGSGPSPAEKANHQAAST